MGVKVVVMLTSGAKQKPLMTSRGRLFCRADGMTKEDPSGFGNPKGLVICRGERTFALRSMGLNLRLVCRENKTAHKTCL